MVSKASCIEHYLVNKMFAIMLVLITGLVYIDVHYAPVAIWDWIGTLPQGLAGFLVACQFGVFAGLLQLVRDAVLNKGERNGWDEVDEEVDNDGNVDEGWNDMEMGEQMHARDFPAGVPSDGQAGQGVALVGESAMTEAAISSEVPLSGLTPASLVPDGLPPPARLPAPVQQAPSAQLPSSALLPPVLPLPLSESLSPSALSTSVPPSSMAAWPAPVGPTDHTVNFAYDI